MHFGCLFVDTLNFPWTRLWAVSPFSPFPPRPESTSYPSLPFFTRHSSSGHRSFARIRTPRFDSFAVHNNRSRPSVFALN
jgi:hypothetical protein